MSLFPPATGPRVFALPPGVDFGRALVAGLEARLAGCPPEALADVEIWVNTQRARRRLAELMATGPPRLLPRIRVVTELASDPLAPLDLPPPVPELRRRLELARLVSALLAAEPALAADTAAFELAESLGELLDEMQGEGVRSRGARRHRPRRARGALAAQPALPRAAARLRRGRRGPAAARGGCARRRRPTPPPGPGTRRGTR